MEQGGPNQRIQTVQIKGKSCITKGQQVDSCNATQHPMKDRAWTE